MSERQPRGVRIRDEDGKSLAKAPPTYKIEAYCENCDFSGEIDVPKGTPFPYGEPVQGQECPECGCATLRRYELEEEEPEVQPEDITPQVAEDWIRRALEDARRPTRPYVPPYQPPRPTQPTPQPIYPQTEPYRWTTNGIRTGAHTTSGTVDYNSAQRLSGTSGNGGETANCQMISQSMMTSGIEPAFKRYSMNFPPGS